MRFEPEIWTVLECICQREDVSMGDLIDRIEATPQDGGRTSAVRVFAVNYLRVSTTEDGHRHAGHPGLPQTDGALCEAAVINASPSTDLQPAELNNKS